MTWKILSPNFGSRTSPESRQFANDFSKNLNLVNVLCLLIAFYVNVAARYIFFFNDFLPYFWHTPFFQHEFYMFLNKNLSKPYVHIRNLPIFLKTASSMPLKCLAPSFIMEANPGARPTFIAILKSSRGSLLALERTLQIQP